MEKCQRTFRSPLNPPLILNKPANLLYARVAKWYQKTTEDFVASEPELWIYDESLLRSGTRPAELVWRMEVTSKDVGIPIRELTLINAQRGNISLHFNEIDTAWQSHGNSSSFNSNQLDPTVAVNENSLLVPSLSVKTYTANSGSSLPGTLLCNQTDPNCAAGDLHAKAAHKYAIGTFNLYATQFGRNSIDNNGMTITSTVHYCESIILCPFGNAFWSGTQMVYGDAYGFPLADDVVAHELTHGVTQYELKSVLLLPVWSHQRVFLGSVGRVLRPDQRFGHRYSWCQMADWRRYIGLGNNPQYE